VGHRGVVVATLAVAWGRIVLLPAFGYSDKERFLIVGAAVIFLA
jgi:hypothetical protein